MSKTIAAVLVAWSAYGSLAQETTLTDVRRDLADARKEVDKVVVFCDWCKATGKIEGKPCEHCDGHGTLLKPELKYIEHKRQLQSFAQKKGQPKSRFADFDIADRLAGYEKQYDDEAFKVLSAYVAYVKVVREHQQLIKQDERLTRDTEQVIRGLDSLIVRHGRRLRVKSMKMLYEDDASGKVGTFVLYGKKGTIRIDGREADRYQLRTLKDHAVLVRSAGARQRKGFILAEIIGKDTYKTDDGREIKAVLLQAY